VNAPGAFGGGLFAGEFLEEFPQWNEAREGTSEAVTEDEFIWQVLHALDWSATLRQ